MKKSKKLRRQWWKGLSSKEQAEYINKKMEQKAAKRLQRSLTIMRKYGNKYPCSKCFHRKTKSCTDDLPNGCEHWYFIDGDGRTKEGIAYQGTRFKRV